VPIFGGFFSKDEILWKTWSTTSPGIPPGFGKALWFIGVVTALLTAIYMTRLMVMTFWGKERFEVAPTDELGHRDEHAQHDAQTDTLRHGKHRPHESPPSMTVPLIVLALLSTIGGLVGVPYALSSLVGGHPENYFERSLEPIVNKASEHSETREEGTTQLHWLSPPPQPVDGKPAVEALPASHGNEAPHSPEEISQERLFTLISVMVALTGIGIGWVMFQSQPLRRMPELLENKYYVDEIYDAAIINPILVVSREGLWKLFDLEVIDGTVNGLGRVVTRLSGVIRYLQVGFVRGYAAIILAGAIIVIGYFAYNGAEALRFLVP
jgi:NADH-quinone oxidoreductase subunit L